MLEKFTIICGFISAAGLTEAKNTKKSSFIKYDKSMNKPRISKKGFLFYLYFAITTVIRTLFFLLRQ